MLSFSLWVSSEGWCCPWNSDLGCPSVPPSRLRVDGVFLCGPVLAQVRRCPSRSTSFEAQVATHTEAAAETPHPIILRCAFKVIHNTCNAASHIQLESCMLYTAIHDTSQSRGISETLRTEADFESSRKKLEKLKNDACSCLLLPASPHLPLGNRWSGLPAGYHQTRYQPHLSFLALALQIQCQSYV